MKQEINLHALMERMSTLESEARMKEIEFQDFRRVSRNEMEAMQERTEQLEKRIVLLENDKETLEERVEMLEAITVKSGRKSVYNRVDYSIYKPAAFSHYNYLIHLCSSSFVPRLRRHGNHPIIWQILGRSRRSRNARSRIQSHL
jgi:hypothetical protein